MKLFATFTDEHGQPIAILAQSIEAVRADLDEKKKPTGLTKIDVRSDCYKVKGDVVAVAKAVEKVLLAQATEPKPGNSGTA